jgi:hypothetical protein
VNFNHIPKFEILGCDKRHRISLAQVLPKLLVLGEGPRGHEILHHFIAFELVLDGVHVVRAGLLKKPLEVVCQRSRLALATTHCISHTLHVRAARFLVVVIVSRDRNPLRRCFRLFLPPLMSWMTTLDGAALLLQGTASLSPEIGRGLVASLLMAYWAAMLSSSSVVYLKKLFGAQKGGGCRRPCMSLPDAFGPGPLGPRPCTSQHGFSPQHSCSAPMSLW